MTKHTMREKRLGNDTRTEVVDGERSRLRRSLKEEEEGEGTAQRYAARKSRNTYLKYIAANLQVQQNRNKKRLHQHANRYATMILPYTHQLTDITRHADKDGSMASHT